RRAARRRRRGGGGRLGHGGPRRPLGRGVGRRHALLRGARRPRAGRRAPAVDGAARRGRARRPVRPRPGSARRPRRDARPPGHRLLHGRRPVGAGARRADGARLPRRPELRRLVGRGGGPSPPAGGALMGGLRRWAPIGLAALLAACAAAPPGPRTAAPAGERVLFAAETAIQDEWQPVALRGETEYRIAVVDGRLAIRAIGRQSASGLLRPVQVDPSRCPVLEWTWRVERLQPDADLRVKEADDVAASIFLFFGDPGLLISPNRVPTLRYVWTSARL